MWGELKAFKVGWLKKSCHGQTVINKCFSTIKSGGGIKEGDNFFRLFPITFRSVIN